MKRFVPYHFIRALAVAGLLSVVLFASYATFHRLTAHACSNYHVYGATARFYAGGFSGEVELWYNSCTGYNTAQFIFFIGGAPSGTTVSVVGGPNEAGYDKGNCSYVSCTTPNGVYSPNDPAYACIATQLYSACTDSF